MRRDSTPDVNSVSTRSSDAAITKLGHDAIYAGVSFLNQVPPLRITTSVPWAPGIATTAASHASLRTPSPRQNQAPIVTVKKKVNEQVIHKQLPAPKYIHAPPPTSVDGAVVADDAVHDAPPPPPPTSAASRSRWIGMDVLAAARNSLLQHHVTTSVIERLTPNALQCCLVFLSPADLDINVVHVCRAWHLAVRISRLLCEKRFTFLYSGVDYDGKGIIKYLSEFYGCGRVGLASANYVAYPVPGKPQHARILQNPSVGTSPLVQVAEVQLLRKGRVESREESALNTGAMKRALLASRGSLHNILSLGVSHFETQTVPYAWVGVDFGPFTIRVSHYTIGSSTAFGANTPFPTGWELQGCVSVRNEDERRDWSLCQWHTLDQHYEFVGFAYPDKMSLTFKVKDEIALRWKALQRIRLVQTSRNTQWGYQLVCSGLEFYGNIFSSRIEK